MTPDVDMSNGHSIQTNRQACNHYQRVGLSVILIVVYEFCVIILVTIVLRTMYWLNFLRIFLLDIRSK